MIERVRAALRGLFVVSILAGAMMLTLWILSPLDTTPVSTPSWVDDPRECSPFFVNYKKYPVKGHAECH